jgi:NAD(P)-dependent dehydrogenase (short-subunit alcohol dehydrogenase family)
MARKGRLHRERGLVTGAASGIGAASVRLFAAEGAAVVIADIDEEGGSCVGLHLEVEQCGGGLCGS